MVGMGSHQSHGNGEEVWLTPPEIIKALGPFDLDPCFGEPRPWNTAKQHYGPDDFPGGLHLPWTGLVWCNPPYDSHTGDWLRRCADHGNAIALIFARTETEDFHHQVWMKADCLFFFRGRLFFHHPDGRRAKHNGGAPSVLVAYGSEAAARVRSAPFAGHHVNLFEERAA